MDLKLTSADETFLGRMKIASGAKAAPASGLELSEEAYEAVCALLLKQSLEMETLRTAKGAAEEQAREAMKRAEMLDQQLTRYALRVVLLFGAAAVGWVCVCSRL